MSSIDLDGATLTMAVNRLLALKPDGPVTAIDCARVGKHTRLTLSGVRTGMKVFGMAIPPLDADLLLTGTWQADRLRLTWELEAVRGIPPMAAKLVGRPTLAKLLVDALGGRWGLDRALSAEPDGDLVLLPGLLVIPGWTGLRVDTLALPGNGDEYVVSARFTLA